MSGLDLARMAQRVADDPTAPIRARVHAIGVLHRLRHGLPVSPRDHLRLRLAHGVRRREVIALAERWCGATG